PWAKFSTRSTPKISDSPDAIRKRNIAAVSPLRLCANTNARSGIAREFLGDWSRELRSGRGSHGRSGQTQRSPGGGPPRLVHELRRVHVLDGLDDREREPRILDGLPVELATVGLVIFFSDSLLPDRRVDGEAQQRLRHLVRVGAARLLDGLREELHAGVALDRPRGRVLVLQVLGELLGVLAVRSGNSPVE